MTALSFDEARAAFEKVQERYAEFGAWDTEPRGAFVDLIEAVYEGRGHHLHEAKSGVSTTGATAPVTLRRMVSWQMFAYSDARGKVTRRIRERMFTECTAANQYQRGKDPCLTHPS